MKKAIVACLLAIMMVGFSASAFAFKSSATYSNQWDGEHDRDWINTYEDDGGCIVLGNNPWSILNKHNRGNNPHKLLAYWLIWYHNSCDPE